MLLILQSEIIHVEPLLLSMYNVGPDQTSEIKTLNRRNHPNLWLVSVKALLVRQEVPKALLEISKLSGPKEAEEKEDIMEKAESNDKSRNI